MQIHGFSGCNVLGNFKMLNLEKENKIPSQLKQDIVY